MTKSEFYLRAMLSLAANPKYVEIKSEEDENGNVVQFPTIDEEIIFIDAEALAKEAEKRMENPFDDDDFEDREPLKTILQKICTNMEDIRDSLNGNLSVIVEEA